jgi:hypothetical protein
VLGLRGIEAEPICQFIDKLWVAELGHVPLGDIFAKFFQLLFP